MEILDHTKPLPKKKKKSLLFYIIVSLVIIMLTFLLFIGFFLTFNPPTGIS